MVGDQPVPKPIEQAAIARMKELRAEHRSLRYISEVISAELRVLMAPMTIRRILDRVARGV
jgi:hypothetical protein